MEEQKKAELENGDCNCGCTGGGGTSGGGTTVTPGTGSSISEIINATLKGNIIPDENNVYTIGSDEKRLKGIYANEIYMSSNTLYINGTPVFHTDTNSDDLMFTADADQSIKVKTTGNATTNILSEQNIEIRTSKEASNVNINAGDISTGTTSNVNINASGNANINSNKQTTIAGQNVNLEGAVAIRGGATIDNLSISGNLTILGKATQIDTDNLTVKDNIIVLNNGEVGAGVTAGQAGIRVDRGDYEDYAILFDETDDMFKIGQLGNLETIATLEYVNTYVDAEISSNTHTHTNKTTLDKISESDNGNILYNGSPIYTPEAITNADITAAISSTLEALA